MKKIIIFILAAVVQTAAFAETLKTFTLEDQFETKTILDESIQWLIFSADKDVSDKVNKAFEDLKITDIKSLNGMYLADISKMPSMVTSMFALPKMRKYPFRVVLDQEGITTTTLPKQKAKVTMMTLKKLEVVSTEYADTTEAIKKFIENQTKPVVAEPELKPAAKKSK